jgi:hypothetical protein
MWDVAGYFYGRQVYTLARFSPVKSRRRGDSATFAAAHREDDQAAKAELAGCSTESRQ